MHSSTNLVGYLGQNAASKTLQQGRVVTTFSIAFTETWRDANQEKQERTTWFNCSYFTAEMPGVAAYLLQGALVLVTGKVSARAYTDRNGAAAASLDLLVDTIRLLAPPKQRTASEAGKEYIAAETAQMGAAQAEPKNNNDDLPF